MLRGLTEKLVKSKGIYYNDLSNKWIIPLYDEYGNKNGYTEYSPEISPKYTHHIEDKSKPIIYNAQVLREAFYGKPIFITEGQFDALSVEEIGFLGVSALGAKLNHSQLKTLLRYSNKLILLFDSDTPGQDAAARVCKKYSGIVHIWNFICDKTKDGNEALQVDRASFKKSAERMVKEVERT